MTNYIATMPDCNRLLTQTRNALALLPESCDALDKQYMKTRATFRALSACSSNNQDGRPVPSSDRMGFNGTKHDLARFSSQPATNLLGDANQFTSKVHQPPGTVPPCRETCLPSDFLLHLMLFSVSKDSISTDVRPFSYTSSLKGLVVDKTIWKFLLRWGYTYQRSANSHG